MNNIIEMKNIHKSFGEQIHVLKNINLSIQKGDFVAIVGQSGSGKSTLMNIIGCLDTQTSGLYKIGGLDTSGMDKDALSQLRCEIFGFIFQRYNLLNSLSVIDNVSLPSIYYGMEKKTREKKAYNLLRDLNLEQKAHDKPNKLSGGQQQRVSIARALMNEPQVILADEPTGALDSKSGEMVMNILKNLHEMGHTIILVTHDKQIASYANRMIELRDGEVISDSRVKATFYDSSKQSVKKSKKIFSLFEFKEVLHMSIQAIFAHKMRSVLTMLGIIIGITSVISVVALGEGSKEGIITSVNSMGSNTIEIIPGAGFGDIKINKVKTLKAKDADTLAKQSYVQSTSVNIAQSGLLIYKNRVVTANMNGVGAQFFDARNEKIGSGRGFNADEVSAASSVAVINQNIKKELFKDEDAVGKVVFFNKQPFHIIGIISDGQAIGPPDLTLSLYSPYTAVMYKITGSQDIASITVKVYDEINPHIAEDGVVKTLKSIHGKKDFFTVNSDSIRRLIDDVIGGALTLLIMCIAAISLSVGGLGVMNIMLVSVTERTKEIGIRMAIGAKQKNILRQFLVEAILLCFMGGVAGLALSFLIGFVFNTLNDSFQMVYSALSVMTAIACSSIIGVIFGYIPAKNASNLNPIEALIQE